ncbi:MAG: TerD family protein [Merdibacter sp.]
MTTESNAQHFGMVENAYIRIVNQGSQETIASYRLTEDYPEKLR